MKDINKQKVKDPVLLLDGKIGLLVVDYSKLDFAKFSDDDKLISGDYTDVDGMLYEYKIDSEGGCWVSDEVDTINYWKNQGEIFVSDATWKKIYAEDKKTRKGPELTDEQKAQKEEDDYHDYMTDESVWGSESTGYDELADRMSEGSNYD